MAFEIFSWSMVAVSLVGTVLNVRGNAGCWYVWAVGNIGWMTVGVGSGVYSLAALQGIYLVMNYFGVKSWAKARSENQRLREELALTRACGAPLTPES